jgi:hypothetical protein
MAEIKDVYSLEFNSSQFQGELQSAIQRIEELNDAMNEGKDSANDLSDAQLLLENTLKKEATSIDGLNSKKRELQKIQQKLNVNSQEFKKVNNEITNINKKLADSTANVTNQQRGFGQSLVAGTRAIGQMRRVTSTLTFAFRALSAALPFGLIMSFAGPIIDFFSSLFTSTDNTADNMEKLNDTTLSLTERLSIAEVELEKLNAIESNRGKLTDEEEKRRRELVKTYKETSEQIIQEEEDRFLKISGMQIDTERIRIKLRGESIQQIKDSAELERKAINLANEKQRNDAYRRMQDALKERDKLRNMGFISESIEQDKIARQAEDEWNAINQLQNAQIDQLNKDTTKAINDFTKKSNEEQRKKALDAANKSIEDETNRLREIILRTEEGTMERVDAEANLIDQLLILRQKYAKELELDDTELRIMQLEGLEEREKLFEKHYENLKEKKDKNKDAIIGPTREDLIQKLKELNDALKAELDIYDNNNEAKLAKQLAELETERNDKLLYAAKNITDQEQLAKAFEDIDEGYNNARKELEKKANIEILNNRIKLLESLKLVATNSNDKAAEAELNKQIEQAKLQVIELNKINTDGAKQNADRTKAEQKQKEEDDKEALDKQKELIDQSAQLIQGVSDNVFNVLNAQVQAYIEGLDKAIDKSKSALDEIRSNSENYNARQLEIEKERLEKLEAERARAVEREKNLAQVQVAINAAIAISKAAAEGGGVASAITIALTLASLVAGLAQARVAAGNAFFHGVEYLERGQNKSGRDTIPAMLNEGERVITTDTNNKYWDVLSAVHNNRIPADVLNTFSKAYQQGGIKSALGAFGDNVSLSSELGQKSIFVNVAQTYGGLENRLERIENVLTELPKYMPRTTVSANANGIFRIVEQRQARKNFSKNWSK